MSDIKIKHLEMIQNVITRMASNSFSLKAWAVTLVAAVFALAGKDSRDFFVLIAYVPIIFFWGLDAHYLKLERQYRNLFDDVRNREEKEIDFSMAISDKHKSEDATFAKCVLSPTEIWFYLPCAVLVASIIIIIHLVVM